MTREIVFQPQPCAVCRGVVRFETMTSPTPGAPTLIRIAEGAWLAPIEDDEEGMTRMVVVCSESCAQFLLRI